MRKKILALSLVLVLLMGIGACGGEKATPPLGEEEEEVPPTDEEEEEELPGEEEETGESNRFLELIGLIPSIIYHEGNMGVIDNVVIIDYASFWEDNDIPFSTPEEYFNVMAEDEIGLSLIETGSYITGNSIFGEYSTIEDKNVGYNATDVDAEIYGLIVPGVSMVAAIGRFSPQATEDALSHQDEWPTWVIDAYTTEEYSGVTIHSWGDGEKFDLLNTLSPPHLDNLGRAKPLAVTEEYLFSAVYVSDVKTMIDAARNQTDSLADIPEWALVANEMSAMGVWATIIEYAWILASEEPLMNIRVIDDPGPRLKRFTVFGSGLGRDEKGIYTAIVLVCESPDDAQENISLLEQRIGSVESVWYEGQYWDEIITDTEIHVEGNVLIAKLYTPYFGFWSGCVHDNLLLYEL